MGASKFGESKEERRLKERKWAELKYSEFMIALDRVLSIGEFRFGGMIFPCLPDRQYSAILVCNDNHEFAILTSGLSQEFRCPICNPGFPNNPAGILIESVSSGRGEPRNIPDMENGRRVSVAQRKVAELVDGSLNYKCQKYFIDVAVFIDGIKVAIEYDSWYHHSEDNNIQRDLTLWRNDWRVIHIKANGKVPTKRQLNNAIERAVRGLVTQEIVLADWGKGVVFDKRKGRR